LFPRFDVLDGQVVSTF